MFRGYFGKMRTKDDVVDSLNAVDKAILKRSGFLSIAHCVVIRDVLKEFLKIQAEEKKS
jgi:hypothetical protein